MLWDYYREVSLDDPDDVVCGHLVRRGDQEPTPDPKYKLEMITTVSAPTKRSAVELVENMVCKGCHRLKSKCREEQAAEVGLSPSDLNEIDQVMRDAAAKVGPKLARAFERMKAQRQRQQEPEHEGPKVDHKTGKPLEPIKDLTVDEIDAMYAAMSKRGVGKPEA